MADEEEGGGGESGEGEEGGDGGGSEILDESVTLVENDADKTGLSDSDEETETYDPMPYAFVLKDIYLKPLALSPDKLYNSRISCPNFEILLDHTIAVLWLFYSGKGHEKLGTAQIHWAIQFLEGLVNERNQHTPDVEMAIEHLQDALLEVGASLDEEKISKRHYDDEDPAEFSIAYSLNTSKLTEADDYLDFAKDLLDRKEKEKDKNTSILETPSGIQTILEKSRRDIAESLEDANGPHTPSIILNDMLEDDPERMVEMLENTTLDMKKEEMEQSMSGAGAAGSGNLTYSIKGAPSGSDTTAVTQECLEAKTKMIKKAMTQIEQIKDLLLNLDEITACPSPDDTAKLKDLLKNL